MITYITGLEAFMSDRLSQILNFFEAIEVFNRIERSTYLSDHSRHEADTDHTWHMAMLAILLHDEISCEVDLARVLLLILVHDLCEIVTGDTFAHLPQYGDRQEEHKAAEKIFALLPADLQDQLLEYWTEFTFGTSSEGRFARALDRLQALAQNIYSDGRVWKEREITEQMSRELNHQAMSLDPNLAEVFERLYKRADEERLWFEQAE
jgi:putative hydrolase of HD superfamily